jgi:hypothetical protein
VIDLTLARLLQADREREIAARHLIREIHSAAETSARDACLQAPPERAAPRRLRPASTSGEPR